MSPVPLLEASTISKSFGRIRALNRVDVSVDAGEIVCLLGPNGAGKTTLSAIVAGLLRPDHGDVHVCGIDVSEAPQAAHRYLGFAPQETGVYPMLDVRANLRVFCELAGLRGKAVPARTDELVARLLLTKLVGRRVQELSGGERRRLHLAIALVHEPKLLLLDEPSVGADVETRRRLLTLVRELASSGCGILYSTHYLGEVEELRGSIVILNAGSVVARGSLDEVIATEEAVVLELLFSGAPAPLDASALGGSCLAITRTEDSVRVTTRAPGLAAARALSALGSEVERLRAVNTLRPSLEDFVASLASDDMGNESAAP